MSLYHVFTINKSNIWISWCGVQGDGAYGIKQFGKPLFSEKICLRMHLLYVDWLSHSVPCGFCVWIKLHLIWRHPNVICEVSSLQNLITTATRIFLFSIQVQFGWRLSDKDLFLVWLNKHLSFLHIQKVVRMVCMLYHTMHNSKNKQNIRGENILSDSSFSLHNRLNLNWGWANKTDKCRCNIMWSLKNRSFTIRDEDTTKKNCCNWVTSVISSVTSQQSDMITINKQSHK